jgi:hypothetical protein
MRARDLLNKLHEQPFQPFHARMSNNATIDVLDPNTVVVGHSSAIMPMEAIRDSSGYFVVTRWRTVALARLIEFVDIDPTKPSPRRKRASS